MARKDSVALSQQRLIQPQMLIEAELIPDVPEGMEDTKETAFQLQKDWHMYDLKDRSKSNGVPVLRREVDMIPQFLIQAEY